MMRLALADTPGQQRLEQHPAAALAAVGGADGGLQVVGLGHGDLNPRHGGCHAGAAQRPAGIVQPLVDPLAAAIHRQVVVGAD